MPLSREVRGNGGLRRALSTSERHWCYALKKYVGVVDQYTRLCARGARHPTTSSEAPSEGRPKHCLKGGRNVMQQSADCQERGQNFALNQKVVSGGNIGSESRLEPFAEAQHAAAWDNSPGVFAAPPRRSKKGCRCKLQAKLRMTLTRLDFSVHARSFLASHELLARRRTGPEVQNVCFW
jgi:hypothetical protein